MSAALPRIERVAGRLDTELRLVSADPQLAALHARAGGEEGGRLAVPQIAALARLAQRLGIVISRAAIAADGSRDLDLWVRATPDESGVALDIGGWTPRAPFEPLRTAPQREADFLRAEADWTFETDEGLRLTALSAAAEASLGAPPARLIGRPLTDILHFRADADGAMPLLTALAAHQRFSGQRAETAAGRTLYLSGVPLIDGMGRFSGFRGGAVLGPVETPAVSDPTPPLSQAPAFGERLDRALREPLDQIIAQAESLQSRADGPLRNDYQAYAGDIASAGRHLLALVDDLVDLQAIERPDFRVESEGIDLADIARRAAGLMAVRAAGRGVQIDTPASDEQLPAAGDFRRVLQIAMNLLTNAIRHSPEGGAVWIRCESEGDLACLIVADQGRGIAPDDQARIFEKFERVAPEEGEGTGLGLYIARRLARAMGGDLSVDSAPGQGARFTLTLPAGD